jgi:hypothetical protein
MLMVPLLTNSIKSEILGVLMLITHVPSEMLTHFGLLIPHGPHKLNGLTMPMMEFSSLVKLML